MKITFLGAAGTVTGSKYLIEALDKKIIVDAGIFQGERSWREKNWDNLAFSPKEIDAVLLTHAHIDHTGMLPRFVKFGLNCPVYCTKPTRDLCTLLLPDSAKLQAEEVDYRESHGKSRHHPPLALYDLKDALASLDLLRTVACNQSMEILPGISATWSRMGHILGACAINLQMKDYRITFSGDIGRYNVPILKDPQAVDFGNLLLIESTYANRLHGKDNQKEELANVINRTIERQGCVVIPSFAVGRTQSLLYYLRELQEEKRIPIIPIIIDSPMATDATEIYTENPMDFDKQAVDVLLKGREPFKPTGLHFVRDRRESMKLNDATDPMIIISASGMVSGGRILHHLKHKIADPRNTILFVGFQPPGGRGDWLLKGNKSLTLMGDEVPVRAEITEISGLSAHGDRDELLRWCKESTGKPDRVAVVHGELDSAKSFVERLTSDFGWNAANPKYLETWEL